MEPTEAVDSPLSQFLSALCRDLRQTKLATPTRTSDHRFVQDLYNPRTAAMDFVSELVRKRGKGNLQKLVQFIVEILRRYDEAGIELKPYQQKDEALIAIGTLCDNADQYAYTNFSDQNNFHRALHCIVSGLKDPELPVCVDYILTLRPFVEACKDLDEIRPILSQLFDDFFKTYK